MVSAEEVKAPEVNFDNNRPIFEIKELGTGHVIGLAFNENEVTDRFDIANTVTRQDGDDSSHKWQEGWILGTKPVNSEWQKVEYIYERNLREEFNRRTSNDFRYRFSRFMSGNKQLNPQELRMPFLKRKIMEEVLDEHKETFKIKHKIELESTRDTKDLARCFRAMREDNYRHSSNTEDFSDYFFVRSVAVMQDLLSQNISRAYAPNDDLFLYKERKELVARLEVANKGISDWSKSVRDHARRDFQEICSSLSKLSSIADLDIGPKASIRQIYQKINVEEAFRKILPEQAENLKSLFQALQKFPPLQRGEFISLMFNPNKDNPSECEKKRQEIIAWFDKTNLRPHGLKYFTDSEKEELFILTGLDHDWGPPKPLK